MTISFTRSGSARLWRSRRSPIVRPGDPRSCTARIFLCKPDLIDVYSLLSSSPFKRRVRFRACGHVCCPAQRHPSRAKGVRSTIRRLGDARGRADDAYGRLEPCKKEPVTCKNGAATDKDEREMSKERPSHAKKRRATRKRSPG